MIEIEKSVLSYLAAKNKLSALIKSRFPVGGVVLVAPVPNNFGVVVGLGDSEPQVLSVLMESGNVWAKPYTDLTACDDRSKWPTWIRKIKRKKPVV